MTPIGTTADWVMSVAHVDAVRADQIPLTDRTRLVTVDDLPALKYDHAAIVAHAAEALQADYRHRPDPWRLLVPSAGGSPFATCANCTSRCWTNGWWRTPSVARCCPDYGRRVSYAGVSRASRPSCTCARSTLATIEPVLPVEPVLPLLPVLPVLPL